MPGEQIQRVAVIGSGVIGSGWATCFILHNRDVTLYDVSRDRLDLAEANIDSTLRFLRDKGLISEELIERAQSNLKTTLSLEEAVHNVELIQENVPENLEIKQTLLAAIEQVTDPTTLFASSTSGLPITDIAAKAEHPERCIGAHPYNPPYLIPLVELTKGAQTDEGVLQVAREFYEAIGKEPIILQREAVGFIANRLQAALYREAVDLVTRGVCTVEDVDKACLFGPGLRWGIMGPNLVFHLGGGSSGIKGLLEHLGPSVERWLEDMADWKTWPEGWPDLAQDGVKQEMANRAPRFGNTESEIAEFRDELLIELLKFHGKLPSQEATATGGEK